MILVDTGVIVAALVPEDDRHQVCAQLLRDLKSRGEVLLLPATVAAEAGYLIYSSYGGAELEVEFLESVAKGDFQPVELLTEDYARMAELANKYVDFPLGTTDASVIAIAERLEIDTIATIDRRHFTAVRPRHVKAFNLLPAKL